MRRLAASLFGRKDNDKRKESSLPSPQSKASLGPADGTRQRPFYVAPPSNSSASSTTTFSLLTPDEGPPPPVSVAEAHRSWKSVFRSRKGSLSSSSLARPPMTLPKSTADVPPIRQNSAPLARSKSAVTPLVAAADDDELSPPVRPFVRNRSSRSSERSSTLSTNSSRSSLVPPLPPIPVSPPPMTPTVYMHAAILRSLSRNPYLSPHPLLTMPTSSSPISGGTSFSSELLYPHSVNTLGTPPVLTLRRHLLRLRLLERVKSHVFTPSEERDIVRASSLFRLNNNSAPSSLLNVTPPPLPSAILAAARQQSQSASQTPSLQLATTGTQNALQDVEATQLNRVERSGISRGLTRWVRRAVFEERCVVWRFDHARGEYAYAPVEGAPVAELEFSEGIEALAGLVEDDAPISLNATSATTRSSYASSSYPPSLPTTNDLLGAAATLSSSRSMSGSTSGHPTPSLSATTVSPTPSSLSLPPATPAVGRPMPSAYTAPPAQGANLHRVPSNGKRRGVRFANSVITPSPLSPHASAHASSEPKYDKGSYKRRSGGRQEAPVVIVHPSSAVDEFEINASPPSPGALSLGSGSSHGGGSAPTTPKRAHVALQKDHGAVPFVASADRERDREIRPREDGDRQQQQGRKRMSSLNAQQQAQQQQRYHDQVVAARKRRESYKVDGGSTSSRALHQASATDSTYSSAYSSSTSSLLVAPKPPARRTATEPGSTPSTTRSGRGRQMWDLNVDETPPPTPPVPSLNASSRSSRISLHHPGSGSVVAESTHGRSGRASIIGSPSISGRTSPPTSYHPSPSVNGAPSSSRRRSVLPSDAQAQQAQMTANMMTASQMQAQAQMYGAMPYGMGMQMPMVLVQPVPVPVFLPMDPSSPNLSSPAPSSRPTHSRAQSSHTNHQSTTSTPKHHIPSSSSSTHVQKIPPSSSSSAHGHSHHHHHQQQQQNSNQSNSHSLISLSRSHSYTHIRSSNHSSSRQSLPPSAPPPPVPPIPARRRPVVSHGTL